MKNVMLALTSFVLLSACGGGGGGAAETGSGSPTTTPTARVSPATPVPVVPPVVAGAVTIDVLALYTNEADASVAGGASAKINHFFAVANKINQDSKINLVYRVVSAQRSAVLSEATEISANLDVITDSAAIHTLRDTNKADLVVGYLETARNCGNAWVNRDSTRPLDPTLGYAMVPIDCSADSTAHEIGHNLGLNHSPRQGSRGRYTYSLGHGVDNEFVTVMAYSSAFAGNPDTALYYSNPTVIDCGHSRTLPCGVAIGQANEAYAAESIRRVMAEAAAFR